MKNLIVLLLAMLCAIVLVGCDEAEGNDPVSQTTETKDTSTEDHQWQIVSQDGDCWNSVTKYACAKCDSERTEQTELTLPNHNWTKETVDDRTTLTCTRCGTQEIYINEIRDFSYAQILENYKIGDPGVKHENFNATFESEISDAVYAITIAKLEKTVEYNIISVCYDEVMDVWAVTFWTLDTVGGDQTVYINGNGLTCYIVYGE